MNQEITKALYAESDDMDTEATVISETDEYLASEDDYEEFEYFF